MDQSTVHASKLCQGIRCDAVGMIVLHESYAKYDESAVTEKSFLSASKRVNLPASKLPRDLGSVMSHSGGYPLDLTVLQFDRATC